jgi:DDE family transposase
MQTECSADLFGFAPVEGREVVAAFDGGAITSDAGALLLGAADRAIKLMQRFADCFHDVRRQDLIEHEVVTLLGQRVFGIALRWASCDRLIFRPSQDAPTHALALRFAPASDGLLSQSRRPPA